MTKNKTEILEVINTLKKAGTLKGVKRTGWVLQGVENAESVADHTWRMGLIISLLAPKELDKEKLLEMNTIHDLGETDIGDIKWEEGEKVIGDQEQKHADEMSTMQRIFGNNPNRQKYIDLLREFNEQNTPEAKFLKQVDKLEMALQALEYEEEGHDGEKLDQFWKNAEKYLKGKELEPVFRKLQEMRESL